MKLRTIAEIVGIIGVIIAFLEYTKVEPNVLDKIPDAYREAAENEVKDSEIEISPDDYVESPDLYNIYRAAMSMDSGHSKDIQIKRVVAISLRKNDFKLAISAANAIDSDHTKSITLRDITNKALRVPGQSGYAIIAAELIPSDHTKGLAIREVIDFHEVRARGGNYGELSNIEKYKEIFNFADSSANMGMSEAEAKEFADKWLISRTYEDFLLFREVFTFADSTASMNMSEENAEKFAFSWLDKSYTEEEFYLFKDAFTFADSTAGMSMSEKEAEVFAFRKLNEHRAKLKANKASQGDA